jgi:hypothetical protein
MSDDRPALLVSACSLGTCCNHERGHSRGMAVAALADESSSFRFAPRRRRSTTAPSVARCATEQWSRPKRCERQESKRSRRRTSERSVPWRPGRLAQLVEHLAYNQAVGGSSPPAPTTNSQGSAGAAPFFCSTRSIAVRPRERARSMTASATIPPASPPGESSRELAAASAADGRVRVRQGSLASSYEPGAIASRYGMAYPSRLSPPFRAPTEEVF